MYRILLLIVLTATVPSLVLGQKKFEIPKGIESSKYDHETIVVKMVPGATPNGLTNKRSIKGFEKAMAGIAVKSKYLEDIYYIKLTPSTNLEERINELLNDPAVVYAEPLYFLGLLSLPDDPEAQPGIGSQDYLELINAYQAWEIQKGSPDVIIGVLDTGTEFTHPDLIGKNHLNMADPINGIDDEADGFLDNYFGWDMANNNNDPTADTNPHGTRVAGTIAAGADNGIGITGIGYNSTYLPVKVFRTNTNIFRGGYEGIAYAADQGAKVINLSWGGADAWTQFGQDMINYAVLEKDVVIIAAAGNTHGDIKFYPASFDHVLSVGSSTKEDEKATWATYHHRIDMVAPGVNIFTTDKNGGYSNANGSSMSAAIVSGAAGLVRNHFPNYNAHQIKEQIRVNTDALDYSGPLAPYTEKLGKGRLNMVKALTNTTSPSIRVTGYAYQNEYGPYAFAEDTISLRIEVTNYLAATSGISVALGTEHPEVAIIEGSAQTVALGTLESTQLVFKIALGAIAIPTTLTFRLGFEGDNYQDYQYIEITTSPDFIDLHSGSMSLTMAANGNLGYKGSKLRNGNGVHFDGKKILDDLGVVIANSDDKIAENIVSYLPWNLRMMEFAADSKIELSKTEINDGIKANSVIKSGPGMVNAPNIKVSQNIITSGNEDFYLIEYIIKNLGNQAIENLHTGFYTDWNLDEISQNKAGWVDSLKMGYVHGHETWAGVALVSNQIPGFRGIEVGSHNSHQSDLDDFFMTEKKIEFLKSGLKMPAAGINGAGNDVAGMVSGLTESVGPGMSVKVVFAVGAAYGPEALATLMKNANTYYHELQSAQPFEEVVVCNQGNFEWYQENSVLFADPFYTHPISTDGHYVQNNITEPVAFYTFQPTDHPGGSVGMIRVSPSMLRAGIAAHPDTLVMEFGKSLKYTWVNGSQNSDKILWDLGEGTTPQDQNPTAEYKTAGTKTIILETWDDQGCYDADSTSLQVLAKSPLPIVEDHQICFGETLEIKAVDNQNLFLFSDKNLKNLVAQGQTLILEEVKESISLYVVNFTHDLPSDPKKVFIKIENPIADFSITSIDDNTVLLEAFDNTLLHHEWEIGTGVKFLGPEITYTVDDGVSIPVKLMVKSTLGCTAIKVDSITTKEDLVLSTEEAFKSLVSEISIHPNPSSGVFQVVLKEAISKPVTLSVMDQAGRLIQQSEFGYYSNRLTVDLSHVRKGTYILNISSGAQQEFKRVILQ